MATLPVAVAVTRRSAELELLDAAYAIPVGAVLGAAAVALGRRGRLRIERTLGRVGGRRTARVGRVLGVLGFCLAAAGAIAVGVYAALSSVST